MIVDRLDYLQTLTENLPPVPTLDYFRRYLNSGVSYDVGNGLRAKSRSLLNDGDVAVAETVIPENGEMYHVHDENEVIIVVSGELILTIGDDAPIKCGVGESLFVRGGVPHKAEFTKDTRLIAITVPAGKGWPE